MMVCSCSIDGGIFAYHFVFLGGMHGENRRHTLRADGAWILTKSIFIIKKSVIICILYCKMPEEPLSIVLYRSSSIDRPLSIVTAHNTIVIVRAWTRVVLCKDETQYIVHHQWTGPFNRTEPNQTKLLVVASFISPTCAPRTKVSGHQIVSIKSYTALSFRRRIN